MNQLRVGLVCLMAGAAGNLLSVRPVRANETLLIPTNGTPVTSSILKAGVKYTIEVSGIWDYDSNTPGPNLADAEWHRPAAEDVWAESPGNPVLDVLIDGVEVDWMGTVDGVLFLEHVYSPSHVYRDSYDGQDATIDLSIFDSNYSDNPPGFLTATITPEPTTLILLFAGLCLFRPRARGHLSPPNRQ